MVASVARFGRSPSRTQASAAVMKGIAETVKSVLATVVLVIACRKHIPAPASRAPATIPGRPTVRICRIAPRP